MSDAGKKLIITAIIALIVFTTLAILHGKDPIPSTTDQTTTIETVAKAKVNPTIGSNVDATSKVHIASPMKFKEMKESPKKDYPILEKNMSFKTLLP